MTDPARRLRPRAVVKGAGDLASGVALCLHRAGFAVVATEIARPTVVRRTVAFAQAVYEGRTAVEGVQAVRAGLAGIEGALAQASIPVVVAEDASEVLEAVRPLLLVDGIIAKRNLGTRIGDAPAVVALGPGFVAGRDADAVIETRRGHDLGRVLYEGAAHANTGVPGDIGGYTWQRVLRAPAAGTFRAVAGIGDRVAAGDTVGYVDDEPVRAALGGVLRGLLYSGLEVAEGFKLGDVDPRGDKSRCFTVSDKARAVGGGALEAACALLGGVRFETLSGVDRDEAGAWLTGA
jgi:xanthine dehydrogenase accessory factor